MWSLKTCFIVHYAKFGIMVLHKLLGIYMYSVSDLCRELHSIINQGTGEFYVIEVTTVTAWLEFVNYTENENNLL